MQGELENAMFLLFKQQVAVEGSGRTDKGVHALGQVASFCTQNEIPQNKIKGALNNLLPPDVRIQKVGKAPDDFHARFSAKRKTYRYDVQIGGERSALKSKFLAHYPYEVDLQKMLLAKQLLLGKHNFKGFCSSATNVTNFEREIFDLSISRRGKIVRFEVTGNGFLYNMVRILVGTLLEVGRGKLTEEDIKKALSTGQRKFAGKTMEPCGLFLKKVEYDLN